jgi:hypothetical protein
MRTPLVVLAVAALLVVQFLRACATSVPAPAELPGWRGSALAKR